MSNFNLELLLRYDMKLTDDEHGRRYITPIGILPSVTSVLDATADKTQLKKWRERLGDVAADKIVNEARNNGNMLHNVCENFVLNQPPPKIPMTRQMEYKPFKKVLRDNIETVYGVELPVWSSVLRTAGTTDLFATWRWDHLVGPMPGYFNTIIDYKTSKRSVKEDDLKLQKYKLQATTYAMCCEEQYNLKVDGCVIIVLPNQELPQVFSFNADFYRPQVIDLFEKYHRLQALEFIT